MIKVFSEVCSPGILRCLESCVIGLISSLVSGLITNTDFLATFKNPSTGFMGIIGS
jgi:hypothetical protein